MIFTRLKQTTAGLVAFALFLNHLPLAEAREVRKTARAAEIIALLNRVEDNRSLLRLAAEILGEDSDALEKNLAAEGIALDAKPARLKLVDGNLSVEGLDGKIQIVNPTKGELSYSGRSWRYDPSRDYQKNFTQLRGLWEPHWRFKKKAAAGGLAWLERFELIPSAEAQHTPQLPKFSPEQKDIMTTIGGAICSVLLFAYIMSGVVTLGTTYVVGFTLATIAGLALYYYHGGGRQRLDRLRRSFNFASIPCEGEEFSRITVEDPNLAHSLGQVCRNPAMRDGTTRAWAQLNQRIERREIRIAGITPTAQGAAPEAAPAGKGTRAL